VNVLDVSGVALLPWHIGLALAGLSLALYALARVRLARASEDYANAFFYSPSLKQAARERRQRWQDRCTALLFCAAAFLLATAVLYLR
jgi:hypothetical protein